MFISKIHRFLRRLASVAGNAALISADGLSAATAVAGVLLLSPYLQDFSFLKSIVIISQPAFMASVYIFAGVTFVAINTVGKNVNLEHLAPDGVVRPISPAVSAFALTFFAASACFINFFIAAGKANIFLYFSCYTLLAFIKDDARATNGWSIFKEYFFNDPLTLPFEKAILKAVDIKTLYILKSACWLGPIIKSIESTYDMFVQFFPGFLRCGQWLYDTVNTQADNIVEAILPDDCVCCHPEVAMRESKTRFLLAAFDNHNSESVLSRVLGDTSANSIADTKNLIGEIFEYCGRGGDEGIVRNRNN